jgi:hypothetical protein
MRGTTTVPAVVLAAAALALAPGAGAAPGQSRGSRHLFGVVGFAAGQTVRLSVVNTLPPSPVREGELPPGPIRLRIAFLDGEGRQLGTARRELAAGRSTSFDLGFGRVGGDARRIQLRAVVEVVMAPGRGPDPCHSTLEIIDDDTARTSVFVHPAAVRGFNPQPDPPL